MNKLKAYLKATILVYLSQEETIVEALEVSFDPATSGYSGPIYSLLFAIADRVATLVAEKQVQEITVEMDFNGFYQDPLPYDLPLTTNAEVILDQLYSEEVIKDVYYFLVSSVES